MFVVTMEVAWTFKGTGLPPPEHTQGRREWHPKVTLPRSLRPGRAGTAETEKEESDSIMLKIKLSLHAHRNTLKPACELGPGWWL